MSEDKNQPVPANKPIHTEEIPDNSKFELGQWYWLKDEEDQKERMHCIVHIGSNYIELQRATLHGSSSERIHFKDVMKRCRPVENPKEEIQKEITNNQGNVNRILTEIKDLSRQLSLSSDQDTPESSTAVMCISGSTNIVKYKNELEEAKKKLPELQKELKDATERLCLWMTAESYPLQCQYDTIKETLEKIEERIFHVELYGGLLDTLYQFSDGKPAPINTPVHVMQRICYMDEECLLDYDAGGMNFEKIPDFCEWLLRKNNLNRIFPFPRCVVAFQVRRNEKDYGGLNIFIKIANEKEDVKTYLFIRNGDKMYYIGSGISFQPKLFPNKDEFNFTEAMYAKVDHYGVQELIPVRTYEDMLKEYKENKKLSKKWQKENPKKDGWDNPYRDKLRDLEDIANEKYHRVDNNTVYFDDVNQKIAREAKQYNRIALILQGLFDRSEVFNPHVPVKLYKPEDFAAHIKLIYEEDHILYAGEKPDFEAYRNKLNDALCEGALTIGQFDVFLDRIFEKENEELRRRGKDELRYRTTSPPWNNPGPKKIDKVFIFHKRSKTCTYKWERPLGWTRYYREKDTTDAWLRRVPANQILCLTNYKAGDYKQFFADPRTREEYLQWAPFLLTAEDWVNKKYKDNKNE